MVSNLPQEQKENWANNEIVMPKDTNAWGSSINKLTKAIPIYTANGSFYTVKSYSNNIINLSPINYEDNTENQIVDTYINGMEVIFKSTFTNTGSCSVNIGGLGTKQVKTCENVDLISGIIEQGYFVKLIYDSTQDWFYFVKDNDDKKINEKANISLDNLSEVGADKLNISKMYMTGMVSEDVQSFEQLKQMKHSTFDLSKFTVVGSPTITDDGIASGFSSSNAIKIFMSTLENADSWDIIIPFEMYDATYEQNFFIWEAGISVEGITRYIGISCRIYPGRKLRIKYNYGTGDLNQTSTVALQDDKYLMKLSFKNGTLKAYVKNRSDWNEIISWSDIVASIPASLNTKEAYGKIGGYNKTYLYNKSIDLKQFSITVDGKEVFSGNKTGIDTIKADNYEVVGSPVISNDGVLSNCTFNADYVSSKQTFNLYNANTWEIQCHYNPMGLSNKSEYFMFYSPTINSNGLHLGYKTKSTLQLTVFENGNNVILSNPNIPLNWESYTDYLFKVRFTGTQYLLDYSKDNGNTWIKLLTVNSNKKTVSSPVYVRNGIYSSSGIDYGIKIGITDLNQTKVYIDGNLVYQPCLKIPYTQSKTGSKIVDVAYRDRVIDLYEQEGQAGYYTIDEPNKNFTLPMGEIYGMIESKGTYQPQLLSTMWSDHLLNDMSWLRADTFSWQDGTTYSLAYNELLSEYNNSESVEETEGSITFKRTPKGYKIALATQETAILNKYTADGIAWYYILDTTNKKFKLPRTKFGFEGLRTSVGNDIEAGLPNITGSVSGLGSWGSSILNKLGAFSNSSGSFQGLIKGGESNFYTNTLNLDASLSNPIYSNSDTVQPPATQMYLYFYVGNFTKSAEAQTAGLKAELLNRKADVSTPSIQAPYIKHTYVNDTSGYNIWSNGYCEQWGEYGTKITGSSNVDITLTKAYNSTNFNVQITGKMNSTGSVSGHYVITGSVLSTNSIRIYNDADSSGGLGAYWKTSGYLAKEEY